MRVVLAVIVSMMLVAGPASAEGEGAWVPSLLPTGVGFYSVSLFDGGIGYVYNRQPDVPGSHLFRTTDGGVTYSRVTSESSVGTLGDLQFGTPSIAFALGSATLRKSSDGAQTFSDLALPAIEGASVGLHELSVRGPSTVSAAASVTPKDVECGDNTKPASTAVFTSTDGGETWATFRIAQELRVRDLVIEPNGTGAMVTQSRRVTTEPTRTILGQAGCSHTYTEDDPGHGWITDDGGKTFRQVFTCPDGGCAQVARPSANRVVIATAAGSVASSNDGGASFTTTSVSPRDPIDAELWAQGLEFSDSSTGWLAAGTGIYRTTDGGATWTEEVSVQKTLATGRGDLAVTASGAALVGGQSGVLRRVPTG